MRPRFSLPTLALIAVLAAGCVSAKPSATGRTTPPATTSPAISGSAQQALCGGSNRCLALVTFRGSDQIVARDITDINHPTTVSKLATNARNPLFVSGSVLSYVEHQDGVDEETLYTVPLSASLSTAVAKGTLGIGGFAWSPDGSTFVYSTQSNGAVAIHQVAAGRDRVWASVPGGGPVGCETLASCFGADTWEFLLSYSPDGSLVTMVNSIGVSVFRLWKSDGTLVKSTDSQSPFMSVWSGRSLYFRDAAGVEVWRDGTISLFLPGVAWIRPKASPGGGQIAYEARDAQGWAHTYLVDTLTAKVRDLKKASSEPAFLTSRYIWYQGERACVAADQCGTRVAGVPSGKTYTYDLQDGTEAESIITSVYDVWPHAA